MTHIARNSLQVDLSYGQRGTDETQRDVIAQITIGG